MHWSIGFIIIVTNIILFWRDSRKGLTLYLILACTLPTLYVGSIFVGYHVIGFIPLGILYVIKLFIGKEAVKITVWQICVVVMLFLSGVMTIVSALRFGSSFSPIGLNGLLRSAMLFIIIISVFKNHERYYMQFVYWVTGINFFASLYQLAFVEQSIRVFYRLFPNFHATNVYYHIWGRMWRNVGTFGTPTALGAFSLIVTALLFYRIVFKDSRDKRDYIFICFAVFCGVSALASSFIYGVFPMLIICYVAGQLINRKETEKKRRLKWLKKGSVAAITCLAVYTITALWSFNQGTDAGYQFSYLTRPLGVFGSRYAQVMLNQTDWREGVLPSLHEYPPQTYLTEPPPAFYPGEPGPPLIEYPSEPDPPPIEYPSEPDPPTVVYLSALDLTYLVIRENLLFGVGLASVWGEFVGDSTYLVTLHNSGLLGFLFLAAAFLLLAVNALRRRDAQSVIILGAVAAGGFALPLETSIFGIVLVCFAGIGYQARYMINIKNKKNIEKQQDKVLLMLAPTKSPPEGGILRCTQLLLKKGLPGGWVIRTVDTSMIGRQDWKKATLFTEVPRTFRIFLNHLKELFIHRPHAGHISSSGSNGGLLRESINAWFFMITGVPFVLQLHYNVTPIPSRLASGAFWYLARRASAIVVFPGASSSVLETHYRVNPDKLIIMPNPLEEVSLIKEKVLHENKETICMLGSVSIQKGLIEFIECARALPNERFIYIGVITNEAEAIISDAPKNITFTGPLPHDEAMQRLAGSKMLFFPTHNEGFPITVLEAMGLRLPIIATAVGAIPHMVDEGKGGYILPVQDTKGMTDALRRLINDPELRAKMGAYNREKSISQYGYDHVVNMMTEVYDGILQDVTTQDLSEAVAL